MSAMNSPAPIARPTSRERARARLRSDAAEAAHLEDRPRPAVGARAGCGAATRGAQRRARRAARRRARPRPRRRAAARRRAPRRARRGRAGARRSARTGRRRATSVAGAPVGDHPPLAHQDQPVGADDRVDLVLDREQREAARRAAPSSAARARAGRPGRGRSSARRAASRRAPARGCRRSRGAASRRRRASSGSRPSKPASPTSASARSTRAGDLAGGTPSCSRPKTTSCRTLVEKSWASKSWNTMPTRAGELADARRRAAIARRARISPRALGRRERRHERVDAAEQRRLAGAGRAHDGDELARRGRRASTPASACAGGSA